MKLPHEPTSSAGQRTRRGLFVDDNPFVLRSLRRYFRRTLSDWDLVFVQTPDEALEALDAAETDVIVSDLDLGSDDGVALLERVEKRQPQIVRIVLSGSSSPKLGVRSVDVAHQFVGKPALPDFLTELLRRVVGLDRLVASPELRALVGGTTSLPSAPAIYELLREMALREDATAESFATIVEQDVALTARVLQLARSTFFARRSRVDTVRDAVVRLGVDLLKALVTSTGAVEAFVDGRQPAPWVEEHRRRALATASLARALLNEAPEANQAWLAGMLHGVGELVLASRSPEAYGRVLGTHRALVSRTEVEIELLGGTSVDVGAYLLGLWDLPDELIEAIRLQDRPWEVDHDRLGIAGAVYVASRLVADPDCSVHFERRPHGAHLDAEFLHRVGLADLGRWRSMAR